MQITNIDRAHASLPPQLIWYTQPEIHRTTMPANLTPQYLKAEEEYRRAQSTTEQIACLENMLLQIPKHKGTEKLQADLKTRLKEARDELAAEKKAPKKGKSYKFPRQGAGQMVIVGAPNSGKSRLLKELTNAEPEVAPYPFTTREPFPAMMPWEDVSVQLIDTPPITDSQFEVYIPNLVRSTDVVILCFDGASDDAPQETQIAVDQIQQRKTVLSDHTGFDEDDFSTIHVKTILVATKGADPDVELRLSMFQELCPRTWISEIVELDQPEDIARLRNRLFSLLGMIRIYTKAPGKPADYSNPYTLPIGGTVEDLAGKVHRELAEKVKHAKIWGTSAADGQTVGRDHVLADKDLVELHA